MRRRGEWGALSPAVAILAVMIFWLAGLVIDGARQLSARSRAIAYAQEAARAGASGIDLNADQIEIDVKDAGARVDKYCQRVMADDNTVVSCQATDLTREHILVDVVLENPTTFLAMLTIEKLTAKGQGEAHAEQGITTADETPLVPDISVLPTDPPVTVDPHESASSPTFDPPCITVPTATITRETETPIPTPPSPATPTATITATVTVTETLIPPLPPICIPPTPGRR
jgi:putative Flp pilus-assembly TadE/G-like protein